MSDIHIVTFSNDGTVNALYNERLRLDFLGKQSIRRATDIRHNNEEQMWEIFLVDAAGCTKKTSLPLFATYEKARAFEIKWLNWCAYHAVEPTSSVGIRLAYQIFYK